MWPWVPFFELFSFSRLIYLADQFVWCFPQNYKTTMNEISSVPKCQPEKWRKRKKKKKPNQNLSEHFSSLLIFFSGFFGKKLFPTVFLLFAKYSPGTMKSFHSFSSQGEKESAKNPEEFIRWLTFSWISNVMNAHARERRMLVVCIWVFEANNMNNVMQLWGCARRWAPTAAYGVVIHKVKLQKWIHFKFSFRNQRAITFVLDYVCSMASSGRLRARMNGRPKMMFERADVTNGIAVVQIQLTATK